MIEPNRPLVLLKWLDAHSPGSTAIVDESALHTIHLPLPIVTVGWVLRDDHEGVTICGEYCGEGDYRNATFVPRGMIESMIPVKTQRKSRARTPPESSFDLHLTHPY